MARSLKKATAARLTTGNKKVKPGGGLRKERYKAPMQNYVDTFATENEILLTLSRG